MTNKDLHLQVIACSLFEGVTEFKNVYSAYKMVAKSNKAGIVSTSLLCKEIGKKVYNQLKDLTAEELETIKTSFTEYDWEVVSFIISEYKPIKKENYISYV